MIIICQNERGNDQKSNPSPLGGEGGVRGRFSTLIFASLLLSLSSILFATPNTLRFQGRLTDTSGAPIVGNDIRVKFALYSVATGGTSVWETASPMTVATNEAGLFAADIGPLGGQIFAGQPDLYLQVSVHDGTSFKPLLPRQKLTSVAYAFQADYAVLAATSNLTNNIPDNSVTNAKVLDGAITEKKIAEHSVTTTTLASPVVDSLIPKGMIAMFDQSCPDGWSRFSKLDDVFPRGASTYTGNVGGSSVISGLSIGVGGGHGHLVNNHVHSVGTLKTDTRGYFYIGGKGASNVWVYGASEFLPILGETGNQTDPVGTDYKEDHKHPISSDGSWVPPYLGIVYCKKN